MFRGRQRRRCPIYSKLFKIDNLEILTIPLLLQAYAAGCNIVILASTFERVQIIPGAVHDYIRISSIDCSSDTGKIAAAYDNMVCVYEPTPLIHNNSSHVSSHCIPCERLYNQGYYRVSIIDGYRRAH